MQSPMVMMEDENINHYFCDFESKYVSGSGARSHTLRPGPCDVINYDNYIFDIIVVHVTKIYGGNTIKKTHLRTVIFTVVKE